MASKRISELPAAGNLDGTEQLPLTQAGETRRLASDAFGETIERVFMDRDYGVHPREAASTNAQGINAAISDAQGNVENQATRKVELLFHPGNHDVNAELGYEASTSDELSLVMKGQGRKGTILTQTDDTLRLLRFTNTVANLRNLVLDDLWLRGGIKALYTERVAYSLLRNVTFNAQVAGSNAAFHNGVGSHDVVCLGCHWVHTDARDAIENEAERMFVSASTVGEDCGGVRNSGVLYVGGGTHFCPKDKLPTGDSGPSGLGSYAYYNTGYLSVGEAYHAIDSLNQAVLTDMGTVPAHDMLGMDLAGEFRLNDATSRFWTNISMAAAAASAKLTSEVVFRGSTTVPKELLGENSTASGDWVHDSVIEPRVRHVAGVSATLHDGVLAPTRNNRTAGLVRSA